MKNRKVLLSILSLVLLVGVVFGVMSISASAISGKVEDSDWLTAPSKTLVRCEGESCDHESCNYVYSFAVVGDTQNLNDIDINKNKSYMKGLYNWILDHQSEYNIQYVMGLGDITQAFNRTYGSGQWEEEWDNAAEAISLMDGNLCQIHASEVCRARSFVCR